MQIEFIGTTAALGEFADVSYNGDYSIVTISYKGTTWVIPRPITTVAFNYQLTATGVYIYIANTGNDDTGNGGVGNPYATIAKANTVAVNGDVIRLYPGTYVELPNITVAGVGLECVPGAMGKVLIMPTQAGIEAATGVLRVTGAISGVKLNGLCVVGGRGWPGSPASNTFGANCISFWNGATGTVTNCVVYNALHCGLKEMGHGAVGLEFVGNVSFENGTAGTDHGLYIPTDGILVDGNITFNNAGYGIHAFGDPTLQTITRNVGWGDGGLLLGNEHSTIQYNTFAHGNYGVVLFRDGCHDNAIGYNIFANNTQNNGWVDTNGGASPPVDNVSDYNDFYGTPAFMPDPSALYPSGVNEIDADPQFVNAAIGDLRTQNALVAAMGAYAP